MLAAGASRIAARGAEQRLQHDGRTWATGGVSSAHFLTSLAEVSDIPCKGWDQPTPAAFLKALAELAAAEGKLAQRRIENACNPDRGHDKAIEQTENRVRSALDKVGRQCTASDLAILGAAGLLLGVGFGAGPVPLPVPI